MSAGRLSVLRGLEKFKAGLGAAGVAAIGCDLLTSHWLPGLPGHLVTAVGALLCGVAAAYVTDLSDAEARIASSVGGDRPATFVSGR
jgi:hypothetical protein